jgi:malonate-semialdehyde dehydrogenase (acetylating)/methylmalonate-semialdehyde dehydrogenase
METLYSVINGSSVSESGQRRSVIFNPATGQAVREVALAGRAEALAAVDAAAAALPGWAATTPMKRMRILNEVVRLLNANRGALARLISEEHGKVLSDADGEVQRGLEVVEFCLGIPHLLKGEFSENVGTSIDSFSIRQPVGVCVGITPFNFPVMVPLWMVPVALACGNTFVLKPSEKDSSSTRRLVEIFHEAGLPDGVLNLVQGDREAVETLITAPAVGAVSFVGSTPIARSIYATAAAHGKRCQALGGAKNHMLIMPDADMDAAVDALMGAAYGSAGERCMAISVAVAVGDAGDRLVKALAPRVRALKVGPGSDPQAEMGPLISRDHADKVSGYIDQGVAEGADLVVDGRGLKLQGYEGGYFVGGTLFDHVKPSMKIYQEEIFGPVLSVVRAADFTEGLTLVNSHQYGNGTAIFTQDGRVARAFLNGCNIGMVGVNVPIPVPVAYHTFGGWKQSAFGDNGMHGPQGINFYTKLKTVTARWSGAAVGAEFTMPVLR